MKKTKTFLLCCLLLIFIVVFVSCKKECEHNFVSSVTKQPTCTEVGVETFSCTECDYSYTAEIAETGHAYGDDFTIDTEPNCIANGSKSRNCINCGGGKETVTLAQNGIHDVVDGICTHCGIPESSKGLEYRKNEDGTYTVTDIGTCTDTDIVIGIYNNRDVTVVGASAFVNSQNNIESVTLSDCVVNVEVAAFERCANLKSVVLSKNLTELAARAFMLCSSLAEIEIPMGVTRIEMSTFYGCESLTDIYIHSGIEYIASSAFNYCFSMKSIEVDAENANYFSVDGNLYYNYKDGVILQNYALGKDDEIFVVPENVCSIASSAFSGCGGIKNVVLPNGLRSIADFAFSYCQNLESVSIPDGIESISSSAFGNCGSLSYTEYCGALYLGSEENPYTFLVSRDGNESVVTEIHPDTRIIGSAFVYFNRDTIRDNFIPEGVRKIYGVLFAECEWLTEIVIPDSVEYIVRGPQSFIYKCDNLEVIYCELTGEPEYNWYEGWRPEGVDVIWGYSPDSE